MTACKWTIGILFTVLACGAEDPSAPAPDVESDVNSNANLEPIESPEQQTQHASFDEDVQDLKLQGVEVDQTNDVWLFWHTSENHDEALVTAPPSLANGCLLVGEVVVIWHESRLEEVQSIVTALAAGDIVNDISVGGGFLPTSVAAGVVNHCSATGIWFGGPAE